MGDVTVVIPPGAHDAPISHGTIDYQPNAYRADINDPNSSWLLNLPDHVASHFIHNAGFYPMPQETAPTFVGTARIYHPDGPRSCSAGGVKYDPDADGVLTVSSEHAGVLMESHGYRPEAARSMPVGEPLDQTSSEVASLRRQVSDAIQMVAEGSRKLADRDQRIAELKAEVRAATPVVDGPAKSDEEKPAPKLAKPAKS